MMALKSAYLCFGNKQVFKIICSQYAKYSNASALSVKQTFSENVLETTSEDLSHITPYFSNTFNLAAYVNNSETLKKLVDINVDLSKIEKKPHIVNKILKLDFEKHMKEHIIFLNDYVGLDEVGNFLTKNPLILCEPVQDLQVRVNYLESKGFQNDQIKRIITRNPFWLMFK